MTNRKNDTIPSAKSVNPQGKSPDDAHKDDVISQGNEAAKKKNTR